MVRARCLIGGVLRVNQREWSNQKSEGPTTAHEFQDHDYVSFPITPTLFLPLCPRPRLRLRFRLRDPVSLFASARPHSSNDTLVPVLFRHHHGCSLAAGRPRPRRFYQCLPYS